jgi:hypothetical protein
MSSWTSRHGCRAPVTRIFPVPVDQRYTSWTGGKIAGALDAIAQVLRMNRSPFSNNLGLIYPSEEAEATWAKLIDTSIAAIRPSRSSKRGQ